jgi:hypothetical protein
MNLIIGTTNNRAMFERSTPQQTDFDLVFGLRDPSIEPVWISELGINFTGNSFHGVNHMSHSCSALSPARYLLEFYYFLIIIIVERYLTSAIRCLVFTSNSLEAPRVRPNIRMDETKWVSLKDTFYQWKSNPTISTLPPPNDATATATATATTATATSPRPPPARPAFFLAATNAIATITTDANESKNDNETIGMSKPTIPPPLGMTLSDEWRRLLNVDSSRDTDAADNSSGADVAAHHDIGKIDRLDSMISTPKPDHSLSVKELATLSVTLTPRPVRWIVIKFLLVCFPSISSLQLSHFQHMCPSFPHVE